jgi:hypothetical protein
MTTPVNHPPAAVLNALSITVPDNCTELKTKHGITTRPHGDGAKGAKNEANKGTEIYGKESHHVLQNAAVSGLIGRRAGIALLLDGSDGGLHDQINARQIARNCPGPGPKNFGELVKAAREDLRDSFEKKPMPKEDADALATCVTNEAAKAAEDASVDDDDRTTLTSKTGVAPVKGCFPATTLVWLDELGPPLCLGEIQVGMMTRDGRRVLRTDHCVSELVELHTGFGQVELAGAHQVVMSSGRLCRADRVRAGDQVATLYGPSELLTVRHLERRVPVISLGFERRTQLAVGSCGIWVDVPWSGPPITARALLTHEGGPYATS